MSVFLLLDILLLILIALFMPIGFWRGAHREVFVTLGILFGASLAEWWARPWGRDLAELTSLRESGGAFMVAVLFLVGSTFLLGYGIGAALDIPPPGLVSRILGALIAGANGALLLSFALRNIRIYLLTDGDDGFLDNAVIAHFLSTGIGWLLLGAAVVFVPVVLALALFGRTTEIVEYDDDDDGFDAGYTPARRQFPPRAPAYTEPTQPVYKAESPQVSRYSPSEETRQLTVQPRGEDTNGGKEQRDNGADQHAMFAPPEKRISRAEETLEVESIPSPANNGPVTDGRCPSCRADVRDAEVFCPRCGRVL